MVSLGHTQLCRRDLPGVGLHFKTSRDAHKSALAFSASCDEGGIGLNCHLPATLPEVPTEFGRNAEDTREPRINNPMFVGYEFMLGDRNAADGTCQCWPRAFATSLLWTALAAVMVPVAAFAQDAVGLPEVRAIANTPLAPPSRRAAPRSEAAPQRAGSLPHRTAARP
jgi:hypothetical protein